MAIRTRLWSLLLCICIAGIAVSAFWRNAAPAVQLTTGTVIAPSRGLPDFSLIDQRGQAFGSADLRGHWSLLFFGYTNCPDYCPATLTTLAAVQKGLRAAHAPALPQVIFMSVDAKRDTPAQLAKYVPYFDSQFIGLTAADQPTIEALAKKLGVGVVIQPGSDGNYTVDHSGAIFVLDPGGRLAAILTGPFSVDALQTDIKRILSAPAGSA